jgi:hypothetical protein
MHDLKEFIDTLAKNPYVLEIKKYIFVPTDFLIFNES